MRVLTAKKEPASQRILLSSHHPGFFEAEPATISNDNVIKQLDLQDRRGFLETTGDAVICLAWIGVATWVIVHCHYGISVDMATADRNRSLQCNTLSLTVPTLTSECPVIRSRVLSVIPTQISRSGMNQGILVMTDSQ